MLVQIPISGDKSAHVPCRHQIMSLACLVAYAAAETRKTHGRQPYVTNATGRQMTRAGLETFYLLHLANNFTLFYLWNPVQCGNLLHLL